MTYCIKTNVSSKKEYVFTLNTAMLNNVANHLNCYILFEF